MTEVVKNCRGRQEKAICRTARHSSSQLKTRKKNLELNICVDFPKVYLCTKFIYKNVALKK